MNNEGTNTRAMPTSWITERFPQHADELRRLADEHQLLDDEPLHLAVAYDPGHDSHDVFLFEVVGDLLAVLQAPIATCSK